nr:MAG TPA: hypothetical protein [Caudoviricetes sp.]
MNVIFNSTPRQGRQVLRVHRGKQATSFEARLS